MRAVVKASIVGAVLGAATLALLVYAVVSSSFRYTCEACVTFAGQTVCRSADGRSAEEATRTAMDNACAFVASGMTQTVQCTTKPPTSARCTEN